MAFSAPTSSIPDSDRSPSVPASSLPDLDMPPNSPIFGLPDTDMSPNAPISSLPNLGILTERKMLEEALERHEKYEAAVVDMELTKWQHEKTLLALQNQLRAAEEKDKEELAERIKEVCCQHSENILNLQSQVTKAESALRDARDKLADHYRAGLM